MSDSNKDADVQLSVQTASMQASSSQLANSLVEKSEYAGYATSEFRKACELVEAGILDEAEKLLVDLDSAKLRLQFYATWKEYDRLNALALRPLKDYPKIKKVLNVPFSLMDPLERRLQQSTGVPYKGLGPIARSRKDL